MPRYLLDEVGRGPMYRLQLQFNARRMIIGAFAALLLMTAATQSPLHAFRLRPSCKVDLSFPDRVDEPPLNHLIQFVDDNTLVIAIVVHSPGKPRLVRRGELDEKSAFQLRTLLLDANTGKVLKQASWPTDFPRHSGFVTSINSNLVVLLGDRVELLGRQLELLKELKLPGKRGQLWVARASPSGRNAVFVEDTGLEPGTWAWVESAQLRVIRVWKKVPPQPGGEGSPISDNYITFTRCLPPGGMPPCRLIVRSLADQSVLSVAGVTPRFGVPEFISNNLLFARGWLGAMTVVDLARHRVVFHRTPDLGGDVFGSPVSAPAVSRFVIPVFTRTLELEHLNVFDGPVIHVRVLGLHDVKSVRRLRWLAIDPFGYALSPDGKLLADMPNYKTLLIFRLPPPGKQ